MIRLPCSLLALLVAFSPPLDAEIVWVTLSWKPAKCAPTCYSVLERRLSDIPAVAEVKFNYAKQMAQLRWKPNEPYDDRVVRTPVAWSGLEIKDISIKVRGTITHDDNNVYLESLGDGTLFPLVSPPTPESLRYVVKNNPSSYQLHESLENELLDAEDNFEIVTIEGTLITPFRPPVHLIVENIQYPQENGFSEGPKDLLRKR